jgi:hypothetical protein
VHVSLLPKESPEKGKPVARPGRKAKGRRKETSDGSLAAEGMPCGGRVYAVAITIASANWELQARRHGNHWV